MYKKAQKWFAFVMMLAIAVGLMHNVVHASEQSNANLYLTSSSVFSGISLKSYDAIASTSVRSVVGKTYSITVKQTKRKWDSDFDKDVTLGTVKMTTKIYYGGEVTSSKCAGYVECKITVNPKIVKKNSDGSIQKCGVPQNIVIEGKFNQNDSQVAYPKAQNKEYQLSSSRTSGYNVSGTFGVSWNKTNGFGWSAGVGAGYSSAVTTEVSYPAKLITYYVNNNSGGKAHWEHKYALSYIQDLQKQGSGPDKDLTPVEKQTIRDMLAEISSSTELFVGLMGKLDTKYISTADYISSGYKVAPGYYVDWNKSNLEFKLTASFGGCRGSLSEVYYCELGSKDSEFDPVK